MLKFVLALSILALVQSRSIDTFNSFDEALASEIKSYDFEANFENDMKQFLDFKNKHNKIYENEEEELKRFSIFRTNLLKIKLLTELEAGTATYGVTRSSDLSEQEFKKHYANLKVNSTPSVEFSEPKFDRNGDLPEEFDWRKKGAVTEVKDQGSCGSSWAFSAVGTIESQNKIVNGELLRLSEQELLDCSEGNLGCFGGLMSVAIEDLKKIGGIEAEIDYPYAATRKKCDLKKSLIKVEVEDYVRLSTNEDEIAKYLVQNGPVNAGLNSAFMRFYTGGISKPKLGQCYYDGIDHGILIVGFSKEKVGNEELPYWIIKNSWGHSFGEKGYYLLSRGENSCGIAKYVGAAVIKKN